MKNKIKNLLWRFDVCRDNEEETIEHIEKLADDFAVGFAESIGISNAKELLEIYKKTLI
jgi:hypothetical protein